VADPAFEDVKDDLEIDVNVSVGDSARRDRGNVGREASRANVLGRHTLFVVDAVPIAPCSAAANRKNAIVIFDRVELNALILHDENLAQGANCGGVIVCFED
jgi:hypothetical protein